MSYKRPSEIAEYLKSKRRVLVLTGALSEEISFDGKNLLDYAVEIANKLGAPIGATANTAKGVKARNAKSSRKMWAAEVANYMRYPWQDPIMAEKPELLVFIGYQPIVARHIVSAIGNNAETVVLSNRYVEEATYSLLDASFHQLEQSLQELVKVL